MATIFSNDQVRSEYHRWRDYFGTDDPYESRETVGLLDVLRAHFLVADYFYEQGYGIAGAGPRDPNLLHSAVYRQFVSFGGRDKWQNPYERCATLVFGIVKDHPFHDANKRTGLLVLLYFFNLLNRAPTVSQIELENFVVEIADSRLGKYRRQRKFAKTTDEPDIYFIADYIKRKSRKLDSKYYAITYQELDGLLRGYGFCLRFPKNSHIDVCQIIERKKYFGLGKKTIEYQRVVRIGFPGWKRQVGKGAISTVRNETGLVSDKGYDSEVFFKGADPLHSLIDMYSGPLERLANR